MLPFLIFIAAGVSLLAILASLAVVLDVIGEIIKAGQIKSWNNVETVKALIKMFVIAPVLIGVIACSTALILYGLLLTYDAFVV